FLSSFFSSYSVDLRDLHSFPTRRSSDLSVAVAVLILVQRRVRQTVEQLVKDFQPDVVGLSVMTFQRETARKIIALVRKLRPSARDRKSTRLNSSHVSISYAVFCLKKKKN